MHCPFCNHEETKVIDSRLAGEGQQIRRRRECLHCGERFTTFETAELVMPRIIKADATVEPFDEDKLRRGMEHALYKRPVSVEAIETIINLEHLGMPFVAQRGDGGATDGAGIGSIQTLDALIMQVTTGCRLCRGGQKPHCHRQ